MLLSGRQVAIGSPAELADRLDRRVLELTAEDLPKVIAHLRRSSGVESVTQVGHRAHVLLEETDAEVAGPRLLWELAEAGLEARFEPADANLEDVFVAVAHQRTAGTAARY